MDTLKQFPQWHYNTYREKRRTEKHRWQYHGTRYNTHDRCWIPVHESCRASNCSEKNCLFRNKPLVSPIRLFYCLWLSSIKIWPGQLEKIDISFPISNISFYLHGVEAPSHKDRMWALPGPGVFWKLCYILQAFGPWWTNVEMINYSKFVWYFGFCMSPVLRDPAHQLSMYKKRKNICEIFSIWYLFKGMCMYIYIYIYTIFCGCILACLLHQAIFANTHVFNVFCENIP